MIITSTSILFILLIASTIMFGCKKSRRHAHLTPPEIADEPMPPQVETSQSKASKSLEGGSTRATMVMVKKDKTGNGYETRLWQRT